MQLSTRILIGLVAGAATGLVAKLAGLAWLEQALAFTEPLGTAFIRLITMIVIPLVVASLLVGTASLGDLRKLGRLGGKTMGYYLFTTAVAVTIGIAVSNVVRPGGRIDPATRDRLAAQAQLEVGRAPDVVPPTVKDLLVNIIPRNPIQAAADFDLLSLIFFTIVFGAAVSMLREDRKRAVLTFFEGVNDASIVVIDWVMKLAPYAVFLILAAVVAKFGLDLLRGLLVYAVTVVLGLALHAFGTLALLVRLAARLNPLTFYRRIAAAPLFAFSTSSSSATLPVTMETAQRKLGISKQVSSFVLPLGATINMDGTALYQAVAVMFIAQIYGVPLDIGAQLTIVLTATLASIGAAGVPSAGIITLIVVLNAVGLGARVGPGIALILGVDRILDMIRTSVNVTGDLSCAAFVARSEGEALDPAAVAAPHGAAEAA
jgi:Na+/H+-dicarboxylate symporter